MSLNGDLSGRVAYLVNLYPGISHTFIRREIEALEAQGVEVVRYALRGWDATLVDAGDIAEQERTSYVLKDGFGALLIGGLAFAARRPGRFFKGLFAALSMSRKAVRPWPWHVTYLLEACRLTEWMERDDVHHLHAHFGTNPAEIAHLTQILGGTSYSFTIHGRGEADGGARLHFEKKVGGATFVAAVSAYTRSQLLREIPPAMWPKVKVVHCGLSDAFLDAPAAPFPEAPTFLMVGRLSPEKGHLVMLDALARLGEQGSAARLVVVGDGPMRGEIEARIAALGLGESVTLAGWADEAGVKAALAEATALVQPSFIEGLPVVIMEAMAMGRPVVSTYIAGIPELVRPGETGWLVPAGDADALAEALGEVLRTPPEQLVAMGEASRVRVRERHSVTTEAAKLYDLISNGALKGEA